jgi:hypothetical protein
MDIYCQQPSKESAFYSTSIVEDHLLSKACVPGIV